MINTKMFHIRPTQLQNKVFPINPGIQNPHTLALVGVAGRVFHSRRDGSALKLPSTGSSSQLQMPRPQHFEVKWLSGSCRLVPDGRSKQKHTFTGGQLSAVSLRSLTMYKLEANEIATTAGK